MDMGRGQYHGHGQRSVSWTWAEVSIMDMGRVQYHEHGERSVSRYHDIKTVFLPINGLAGAGDC